MSTDLCYFVLDIISFLCFFALPMKKRLSKNSQPRFVVYAESSEITKASKKAKQAGVKGHNKWAGIILRRELNQ